MKLSSCIIISTIFLCAGSKGQERIQPKASLILNLDYASFRNDSTSCYLEIYYAFYPNLITLERRNNQLGGGLLLWTKLKNNSSGSYVVDRQSSLSVPVQDTSSASFRSTLVSQAGYIVPFGEYSLVVIAQDSLTPSRKDSITLPLVMKSNSDSVVVSDLELCSKISPTDEKENPFYKNSFEVIPNPTLVFGVASNPVVFSYAEFYNLDVTKSYVVTNQVVGPKGEVVKQNSKTRKFGVRNAVEAGTMNVTSIVSGRYRFRLQVADEEGPLASIDKIFYIYNPHIAAAATDASTIAAGEFNELTGEELKDEFRQAQYVASSAEIKRFDQIQSDEGRRKFLVEFWNDVGRGRAGRDPLSRITYLQRVAKANTRFHAMGREGWKTDRGRVSILYGEPDEIQRFPSSSDNKPYEIWQYFSIEIGVLFAFLDRNGFGDYRLVHATKRGELRDDAWQDSLR